MGAAPVPIWLPPGPLVMPVSPVPSPIRLFTLPAATSPFTSSRVVPVPRKFPAIRVLFSVTVPAKRDSPPPVSPPTLSKSLRLPVVVTFVRVAVPPNTRTPPPLSTAVFPVRVLFVTVRVPSLQMPPPVLLAVFPDTRLFVTARVPELRMAPPRLAFPLLIVRPFRFAVCRPR